MAQAFKCDRCGQMHEGYPQGNLEVEDVYSGASLGGVDFNRDTGKVYIELCQGCSESFAAWWADQKADESGH